MKDLNLRIFYFKVLRKLREGIANLIKPFANIFFMLRHRNLKSQRKIIYALTPPPHLTNIGDHAQTIAIRQWLKKHFSSFPVIEINKEESKYYIFALKWLVQPDDVFILQSGGNLGERGMWTEKFRRLLIQSFPNNQIVNLPQSIQFSDTPYGRQEKEKTRRIYASHSKLTMIARDPRSEEIARDLFPHANIFKMPDFVLALPPRVSFSQSDPPQVLLCLRHDNQSALSADTHKKIADTLIYPHTFFDTETTEPIRNQEKIVDQTIDRFLSSDVVVTDRFHGLIFSVVCCKPCVVVPTVDHKLTYGAQWFEDLSFVRVAKDINEIPDLIEQCLAIEKKDILDWNEHYFDKIPALIQIDLEKKEEILQRSV